MGMMAGLGALGMGAAGLFGGSPASNVQMPQMWQMPGMSQAAGGASSGIGNLSNYNTWNIPQAQNITNRLVNNPYAPGYQAGAGVAGAMGQNQALGQYGVGQSLTNLGVNQLPAWAGTVMNTAMDPQQALYNRTLQQVQDQSGAQNAMAGVGTTPYGAGLTNQATANFNIDWQNAQLGRQLSGLSGAGTALTQGGQLATAGQGLSASAPGQYLTSSAIPYSTYGAIGQGQISALTNMGQYGQSASALQQQQIQDYLSYIQQGTGATNAATGVAGAGLNQANLGFNQNLINASMLGGGLGSLGASGYGVPGFGQSTGWGSMFSGPSSGAGTQGMGGWY